MLGSKLCETGLSELAAVGKRAGPTVSSWTKLGRAQRVSTGSGARGPGSYPRPGNFGCLNSSKSLDFSLMHISKIRGE